MTKASKRRRGRPRVKDPAITYKGLPYVVTTFRLKKRTIAEADVIQDVLALGSRTNAIQFAVGQIFNGLHRMSRSMTRAELDREMKQKLKALG